MQSGLNITDVTGDFDALQYKTGRAIEDSSGTSRLEFGEGRDMTPTIELNYHEIEWGEDFMSFECQRCETSFDVPEIFQASKPFYVAVYQMYVFGHFRNNKCPEEDKTQAERLQDILDNQSGDDGTSLGGIPDTITPPNTNPQDVHWMHNNGIWKVRTDNGSVTTDGQYIMGSEDPQYAIGDRVDESTFRELKRQARDMQAIR